ncbi:hypothetical protein HKX48_008064 [Thoreauomyces humboldtii]|nr:hypothetical protein HKX48_008064 [Thoreauomyces humboldtii]
MSLSISTPPEAGPRPAYLSLNCLRSLCPSTPLAPAITPEQIPGKREQSQLRLKRAWESIFERYSREFDDADEIDITKGEIVVDNGWVRKAKPCEFGHGFFVDGSECSSSNDVDARDTSDDWDSETETPNFIASRSINLRGRNRPRAKKTANETHADTSPVESSSHDTLRTQRTVVVITADGPSTALLAARADARTWSFPEATALRRRGQPMSEDPDLLSATRQADVVLWGSPEKKGGFLDRPPVPGFASATVQVEVGSPSKAALGGSAPTSAPTPQIEILVDGVGRAGRHSRCPYWSSMKELSEAPTSESSSLPYRAGSRTDFLLSAGNSFAQPKQESSPSHPRCIEIVIDEEDLKHESPTSHPTPKHSESSSTTAYQDFYIKREVALKPEYDVPSRIFVEIPSTCKSEVLVDPGVPVTARPADRQSKLEAEDLAPPGTGTLAQSSTITLDNWSVIIPTGTANTLPYPDGRKQSPKPRDYIVHIDSPCLSTQDRSDVHESSLCHSDAQSPYPPPSPTPSPVDTEDLKPLRAARHLPTFSIEVPCLRSSKWPPRRSTASTSPSLNATLPQDPVELNRSSKEHPVLILPPPPPACPSVNPMPSSSNPGPRKRKVLDATCPRPKVKRRKTVDAPPTIVPASESIRVPDDDDDDAFEHILSVVQNTVLRDKSRVRPRSVVDGVIDTDLWAVIDLTTDLDPITAPESVVRAMGMRGDQGDGG